MRLSVHNRGEATVFSYLRADAKRVTIQVVGNLTKLRFSHALCSLECLGPLCGRRVTCNHWNCANAGVLGGGG